MLTDAQRASYEHDGFIVVPEGSEGYREDSTVRVNLLRSCGAQASDPSEGS